MLWVLLSQKVLRGTVTTEMEIMCPLIKKLGLLKKKKNPLNDYHIVIVRNLEPFLFFSPITFPHREGH